jgi:hypothetical protein
MMVRRLKGKKVSLMRLNHNKIKCFEILCNEAKSDIIQSNQA